MPSFTPTQQRIMDVLGDGLPHSRAEIQLCLNDEMAVNGVVDCHIQQLRVKLRKDGHEVVCRGGCYFLVRLLANPYKG